MGVCGELLRNVLEEKTFNIMNCLLSSSHLKLPYLLLISIWAIHAGVTSVSGDNKWPPYIVRVSLSVRSRSFTAAES